MQVLRQNTHVPLGLSRLTNLQRLSIADPSSPLWEHEITWDGACGMVVVAALPHLTQLRHLALCCMPSMVAPPAALANATQLQSFFWLGGLGSQATTALPWGPWLSGLRRLSAPADVLACSLPELAAARQLDMVGVHAFPTHLATSEQCVRSRAANLALGWAVQQPYVRHIVLGATDADAAQLRSAMARMQYCRPALQDGGMRRYHTFLPDGLLATPAPVPLDAAGNPAFPNPSLVQLRCYSDEFQFERCLLDICARAP